MAHARACWIDGKRGIKYIPDEHRGVFVQIMADKGMPIELSRPCVSRRYHPAQRFASARRNGSDQRQEVGRPSVNGVGALTR